MTENSLSAAGLPAELAPQGEAVALAARPRPLPKDLLKPVQGWILGLLAFLAATPLFMWRGYVHSVLFHGQDPVQAKFEELVLGSIFGAFCFCTALALARMRSQQKVIYRDGELVTGTLESIPDRGGNIAIIVSWEVDGKRYRREMPVTDRLARVQGIPDGAVPLLLLRRFPRLPVLLTTSAVG